MTKHYSPIETEKKWYTAWEKDGLFNPDGVSAEDAYSIVIPPPNVTGSLHIGHALVNTIQDIIIRRQRMSGKKTLWLPGTDHAGIATQMVVERELLKNGTKRLEIGREKFIDKVWEWKEQSGNRIFEQLKRLGASLDWSRERFTMDEGLSSAVKRSFVTMYDKGMIYRGDYMTNWCPKDHTAISDLEVDHKEENGQISYIEYSVEGGNEKLTVATTRPETLLGDTAVAVNPTDERYKHLIGKKIIVPIVDRLVPIIGDEHCDPTFGSGVVKITPGHDPNDYQIGLRHNLPVINIFDKKAALNDVYPPLANMDRFEARKAVLGLLKEKGSLIKTENHQHSIGRCQRCQTVIEPLISTQWFCSVKEIAAQVLSFIDSKELRIYPDFQTKILRNWLTNIEDWCISRQLWWGHRIPASICDDCGKISVSEDTIEQCSHCGSENLKMETDVLDTWFSSGLFPFSTMGWPEDTKDMKHFYPNSLLVTGYDILFFWVARMLMMGLELTGQLPFSEVYLHGLVRDENGDKMSKTKNNVIDPIELIDQYGADALRFSLTYLNYTGRDLKLSKDNLQNSRNFLNKLWNAHKLILLQNNSDKIELGAEINLKSPGVFDQWILKKFHQVTKQVNQNIDSYEFHDSAAAIYNFIWFEFCDWYIEVSKPVLYGQFGEERRQTTMSVISHVFQGILHLSHPIIPFITEELNSLMFTGKSFVMMNQYPVTKEEFLEADTTEAEQIISVVEKVRSIRGENKVPPNVKLGAHIRTNNPRFQTLFSEYEATIKSLAKLENIQIVDQVPVGKDLSMLPGDDWDVYVDLSGAVDESTKEKVQHELKKLEGRKELLSNKLANKSFTEKAPKAVVLQSRDELEEIEKKMARIIESIS